MTARATPAATDYNDRDCGIVMKGIAMPVTESSLIKKKCTACVPGTPPLSDGQINLLLPEVPTWSVTNNVLHKTFKFKNYHESMAFVNATAWVSHREDHHPDIDLGYNKVTMRYSTHAANGLTENDFICAAKIDALMAI